MLIYFALISLLAAVLFCCDKRAAVQHRRRVPEMVLHLMELVGGVFIIVPLMYIIRHKNRKFKYYAVTYLILAVWIAAIYWFLSHISTLDISMFDF